MSERSGYPAAKPRRMKRAVATIAAVGLASTAIVAAGGGSAGAADLPNAQAVGRLVDGSLGGNPIQSIADVKDARATAPGTTSAQNPLDVTLLNQLNLPLSNLIELPTSPAVQAGVANQVATANLNGASRGGAGAVANNGGALLGDDVPTQGFATLNLTGSALANFGLPALPAIPGLPAGLPISADALGGITATLGAVSATVGTEKGGKVITPSSNLARVDLTIGSPALGALLNQVTSLLGGADLGAIPGLGALLGVLQLPDDCALSQAVPTNIPLGDGITIDLATSDGKPNAGITIKVGDLLESLLGKKITDLDTSNFDLISFLVTNLPKILSKGLSNVITGITTSLTTQFQKCIANLPVLGGLLTQVTNLLLTGQKQITDAIGGLADQLGTSATGPLGTLADGLKNIVDIGLNVQSGPGIQKRDTEYPFESNLEATPNQNTPVVENQTLVRAVEIQVLNAAAIPGGLPSLPGLGSNSGKVVQLAGKAAAARPLALAPGDGAINLALANAAAGPSNAPDDTNTTTPTNSVPPTVVPSTNIPTGIPAGQAAGSQDDGLPVLPLVAILMLMMVSGGAFWQYRMRGLNQH